MKLDKIAAELASRAVQSPGKPQRKILPRGLVLSLTAWTDGGPQTSGWCLKLGRKQATPSDQEIQICWDAFKVPDGATMSESHLIEDWHVVGIEWPGYGQPEGRQDSLFEMPEEKAFSYA